MDKVSKQNSRKISDDVKSTVVETALQHPERGPGRLVWLLADRGIKISTASVYRVLRTEELHTRAKRLEKVEQMRSQTPKLLILPESFDNFESPPEPPESEQRPNIAMLKPQKRTRRRSPVAASGVGTWGFRLLQTVLVALTVWVGYYTAQSHKDLRKETKQLLEPKVDTADQSSPKYEPRSLNNYRAAWDRGLFGTSDTESAKTKPLTAIKQAPKELGLELIGTVVTGNPNLNLAVIENQRKQTASTLFEGDRVGNVRIKKILRNNVIVVTDSGEVLLAMGESSAGATTASSASGRALADASYEDRAADRKFMVEIVKDGVVGEKYSMDHSGFAESLKNSKQMARVRFLPFEENLYADGIEVRMPTRHVLAHLGLRSMDVIKRINGKPVTQSQQAFEAFSGLAGGGEIEVEVIRGGEPVKIRVHTG